MDVMDLENIDANARRSSIPKVSPDGNLRAATHVYGGAGGRRDPWGRPCVVRNEAARRWQLLPP